MIRAIAENRGVATPRFLACSFCAVVRLAPMPVVVGSTLLWRRASRLR